MQKNSKVNRLYHFLTDRWLISGEEHTRLLGVILPALRAGNLRMAADMLADSSVKCHATTPYLAGRWELGESTLPEGSIAIITLDGPIFSWGTFQLERMLQQAAENPKIIGVVLWINGPGGMATYIDVVARQIHEMQKPVAAYVAGYMLSAHLWLGSAAGRIFIASTLAELGSIGTMGSYLSLREYYKQMGVDLRDIYPDTSDMKNKWFRDIEERNDESLVKSQLENLHLAFAHTVAEYRGIECDMQQQLFRGATFNGEEAIAEGIADQVGTLLDAVQWVVAQSTLRVIDTTLK